MKLRVAISRHCFAADAAAMFTLLIASHDAMP